MSEPGEKTTAPTIAGSHNPLPLPDADWRSRWLLLGDGDSLHRVASIAWDEAMGGKIRGEGVTVCGRRGLLHMPGVLSRTGAPRCGVCCAALRLPRGHGAPANALPGEQARA